MENVVLLKPAATPTGIEIFGLGKLFEGIEQLPLMKKGLLKPNFGVKTKGLTHKESSAKFARDLIDRYIDQMPDELQDNPLFKQRLARAYSRISAGTFGRCTCGVGISAAILLKNPLIEHCPDCAKKIYEERCAPFRKMIEDRIAALQNELRGLEENRRALGVEGSVGKQFADQLEHAVPVDERQVFDSRVTAKRRELEDLNRALSLINAGEYGKCAKCKQEIPTARLKVRPFARTCVHCNGATVH